MALSSLLDATTRARVPVLVWGPPGVGKSAAIRKWAADRGLHCWTVIASLREPADFGGLPVLNTQEPLLVDGQKVPTVGFAPPRFAVEAAVRGGVIFLDELTTAPPAVQAALLRAVIDTAFGDLQLDPRKVTIVAAANPPAEAAGGWDLAAPLANRFSHHTFVLSVQEWADAFPSYWGVPPDLRFGAEVVHPDRWQRSRVLVAAFIRSRPALLLHLPVDISQRGQAWASPRTWDFLSRIAASVEQAGGSVVDALPLFAGCVGEGAAVEYATWVQSLDLPDPEDLLAHPERYRHPSRGDQAYAVLGAVCQAALDRLTPERWEAAWRILSLAVEAGGADVAAVSARALARGRRGDLPLPLAQMAPFLPVLQEAGLLGLAAGEGA
jgi:hypothetical protein